MTTAAAKAMPALADLDHEAEKLSPVAKAHYKAAWDAAWDIYHAAASRLYHATTAERPALQSACAAARKAFNVARQAAFAKASIIS